MAKKFGILFSGGKDSTYAAWLAKENGDEIACLISVFSENKESYMFHIPSIMKVEKQAEVMDIPLIMGSTEGEKEKELGDLKEIISKAKGEFGIEGIVTGAVASVYQASRIQKICDELGLECFNPLWEKNQFELLQELIDNDFEVIIVGIAAEGFDESWLGREINENFIEDIRRIEEKNKINPAGEGGEFESFVLNCPLFKRGLKVIDKEVSGEGNALRMEIDVE
jgi:diphthine-ammonia ligase